MGQNNASSYFGCTVADTLHLCCNSSFVFLEHIQSGGSAGSSFTFANIRHHKLQLISDGQYKPLF